MTRLYVDTSMGDGVTRAGVADVTERRGRSATTFRYEDAYVAEGRAPISPGWGLAQRTVVSPSLPGVFADSAPDRWGRLLLDRRERRDAAGGHRPARSLADVDYLLGVADETRQGALRFRRETSGPPLASSTAGVPTTIELPALLASADRVSRDPDDWSAVSELLDAGSGSLGGARPKASVRDADRLWIAKFPHPQDEWDVMAWEKTALDLAETAGLPVPERRLERIDDRSVLLVARFDRGGRSRVGYVSAMTMLGAVDGTPGDYLDLVDPITEHGARPTHDLFDLWRRVAFSAAISNVDDHLRNHGFLQTDEGWTFSPVFDVNPDPRKRSRVTSFDGAVEPAETLEALVRCADLIGVSATRVTAMIDDVRHAVSSWRDVARANGIGTSERARFEPAFTMASSA